MSQDGNDNADVDEAAAETDAASSEQFAAILRRYLARRAHEAHRRTRALQRDEGVESATAQQSQTNDDDDDDDNNSPSTEADVWFQQSLRKKKTHRPKLDLIDDTEESIRNNNETRMHSLGRLRQWICDGQTKYGQIAQYFENSDDGDDKKSAYDGDEEDDDDDAKRAIEPPSRAHRSRHPKMPTNRNNKRRIVCDNQHFDSGHKLIPYNFQHFMSLRECGQCRMYSNCRAGVMARCSEYLFPSNVMERFQSNSRVFCTDFSADGSVLCAASQDHVVHLIDGQSGANCDAWPISKQVESQFSGWSIIDVALSPDHEFVAYSGWSSSIYLVNVYGSHELHETHDLHIETLNSWGRCCVFGVEFDPNSKKVVCALSGGCLILHDLERKQNEFAEPSAHEDDINQATFLNSNVIISGSDDALLRVWDIRQKERCVGGFVGHYLGITCVSTPNDYGSSPYVLSNSKDQSMKLWDLRSLNSLSELSTARTSLQSSTGSFDYRYRGWNPKTSSTHKKRLRADRSLMTYRGHSVSRTLIRSGFSPVHSTNCKYVYCGSSDAKIYIYDTLTAELHTALEGHTDIVRDVCWHPYLPIIVSGSFDGTVVRWGYKGSPRDGVIDLDKTSKRQKPGSKHGAKMSLPNHHNNNSGDKSEDTDDSDDDSDGDSGDDVYELPPARSLVMPAHLRKRTDHEHW